MKCTTFLCTIKKIIVFCLIAFSTSVFSTENGDAGYYYPIDNQFFEIYGGLFDEDANLWDLAASINRFFVSQSGRRMWDNVSDLDEVMNIVESKVCEILLGVTSDFTGTFTMLNAIESKWCDIDSSLDSIILSFNQINEDVVSTIDSKIDVIDNLIQSSLDTVSIISTNDFGGTWTAIDGVNETLCSKFNALINTINSIDSDVDAISDAQNESFFGTCTVIESITDSVELNTSLVCEIAVESESDIDSIDSLVDMLIDQNSTINSKLDDLMLQVELNFEGTFTALSNVEDKVCSIEDQLIYLIDLASAQTIIESLEEKACTIVSKLDELIDTARNDCDDLTTVESLIDPISNKLILVNNDLNDLISKSTSINNTLLSTFDVLQTIESTVDSIELNESIAESKLCIVDSKIDLFLLGLETIESKIDVGDVEINTIDSKLDQIAITTDESLNKLCTLTSKLEEINDPLFESESALDALFELESNIDILDNTLEQSIDKACTVESKIDIINTELVQAAQTSMTIESKIDRLCPAVDFVDSKIDGAQMNALTIESSIDVLDNSSQTLLSKVCILASKVDVVEAGVQMAQEGISQTESTLCQLIQEFQETWTILETIEQKSNTVDLLLDTIESQVEVFSIDEDDVLRALSPTFTALDAVLKKVCDLATQLDETDTTIDDSEIDGTYTAIEAVLVKTCSIESTVEIVADLFGETTSLIINVAECLGTQITGTEVGTTGYIIGQPGRYFLGGEVNYAADGSNPAITIDADRVTLDLCNKTMRQTGGSTVGILITGSSEGVIIQNGAIRDFGSDCIQVASGATGITLRDLRIINSSESGINCVDGVTDLTINRVLSAESATSGLEVTEGIDVLIQDSFFVGNIENGIKIDSGTNTSDRVCVLNCFCGTNTNDALVLTGTNGTLQNVVVDSCCFLSNGNNGISAYQLLDSVIRDNVTSGNAANGIQLTDTCRNVEIYNNVVGNNVNDGIVTGTTVEQCSIQNNVLVLNGDDNYREITSAGPNTVLSNVALAEADADNYVGAGTTINKAIINQAVGTFSTTPGRWRNISMTT